VKVWISGGSGFVGSHLVRAFDDVCAPSHAEVDVTDPDAVRRSIRAFAPDAVIHSAILNDFTRLERDGWAGYVGATRNVVGAAGEAQVVLISTDWVFSGVGGNFIEATPPSPVNAYGMLKAASELVVEGRGAVARLSAVQGVSEAPRSQDAGFGYFVAALVRALRAGERFTVWEGEDINMTATPTLASDAADLIARIVAGGHTGIFHCCGGESVDRRTLALRTVEAFGLDGDLLGFGPPPPQPWRIPYDTSLDARATAATLGVELPSLADQLARLQMTMEEVRA
jgi:dTDP-4-dehydrorhamnose reductase